MPKYINMVEAFQKYGTMDDIENAYPGIFDPQKFRQHVHMGDDGHWLVKDRDGTPEPARKMTAEEMRAWLKRGGDDS